MRSIAVNAALLNGIAKVLSRLAIGAGEAFERGKRHALSAGLIKQRARPLLGSALAVVKLSFVRVGVVVRKDVDVPPTEQRGSIVVQVTKLTTEKRDR